MPDSFTMFDTNIGDIPLNAKRLAAIAAIGNSFFVDETTGSDANTGSSGEPFATLGAALAATTANNGDVIYLQGTAHLAATLAWDKNGVSLIGLRGPSNNNRSRISQTGSSVFSPLVNVTGVGCQFLDIGAYGAAFNSDTAQISWQDAGGRNHYRNCQFFGGGHATAAANAGMRSLLITGAGGGEHLFEECTIGLDSIIRATGNTASLEFTVGSPRNVLRRCVFQAYSSNAANVHVLVGSGGIDRYALFDDCMFLNAQFGGPGATALTAAFSVHASAGGLVLLRNCASVGAGKISAAGPVYVLSPVGTGNGATAGLAAVAS